MARKPKTNCTKKGVDYYRIKRKVPIDEGFQYKDFYGKSEAEAVGKYHDYLNELKNEVRVKPQIGRFGDILEEWLWNIYYRSFEKDSTFARYEVVYRKYIKKAPFLATKADLVTAQDIQKYFNDLADTKTASDHTIKLIKIILKAFYSFLVEQGNISVNLALSLVIPKRKLSETFSDEEDDADKLEYFTEEEIRTLLDGSRDHELHQFIKIKLGTGLRRGEMLGLKWKRVDLEKRILDIQSSVSRTYTYNSDRTKQLTDVVSSPKNTTSRRQAPFPETLIPAFKAVKHRQSLNKLKAGDSYQDNDLVFCTAAGTRINPSNLEKSWRALLKKLNLPHRKIHSLRHTFATQLFAKGVQIEIVSKLLGHKSIETTRQIYVHVLPETRSYTVDMLSEIIK